MASRKWKYTFNVDMWKCKALCGAYDIDISRGLSAVNICVN